MKNELLVLNTLVFLDRLNKQIPQVTLLNSIHSLGIQNAEIRREFISDFENELEEIRKKAEELGLHLFYSIPDQLFKNGNLQFQTIENYFKEAKQMGCQNVKMVIGEYELHKSDIHKMNDLCEEYSVNLTVENDQTKQNGRLKKTEEFIKEYRNLGGRISLTFDIGNYIWQKEDPIENAKILKDYVSYIHIKDVADFDHPKTVLLNQGEIQLKEVLQNLPMDVPIALEYPCEENIEETLKNEILKLNSLYEF